MWICLYSKKVNFYTSHHFDVEVWCESQIHIVNSLEKITRKRVNCRGASYLTWINLNPNVESVVLNCGSIPNFQRAQLCYSKCLHVINTFRPRQNGRCFADDTFKRIFLNENVRILITISLKFAPKGPIDNNPALVQIMAWRRSGGKPLSEPMMVSLLTHICVTRSQWVNIRPRNDIPLFCNDAPAAVWWASYELFPSHCTPKCSGIINKLASRTAITAHHTTLIYCYNQRLIFDEME